MRLIQLASLIGAGGLAAFAQQTPLSGGVAATTLSTASNACCFPRLQATSYKLRVEVPGFAPAERTTHLTADSYQALLAMAAVTAEFQDYPLAGTYRQRAQAIKRRGPP